MVLAGPGLRSRVAVVGLWALLLSLGAGAAAVGVERRYLARHSLFLDAVYYQYYNACLYERLRRAEGRLALAGEQWWDNPRHPLRTVVPLLLAPDLLAEPEGHLLTVLPALGLFLFGLGCLLLLRGHSLLYALAGMGLGVLLPILYDPVRGLGAFLLDLPAALYHGAAVYCLLIYRRQPRRLAWLVVFSLLVALAALGRYVAGMFLLVIEGPVLLWVLGERWRAEGVRALLAASAAAVLPALVLAGPYALRHLGANLGFYRTFSYATGGGVEAASANALEGVKQVFSLKVLAALALSGALHWWWSRGRGSARGREWALSAWLGLSGLGFQVLVLGRVESYHVVNYSLPGLLLLGLSPVDLAGSGGRRREWLGVLVLLAACAAAVQASWGQWELAGRATPAQEGRKAMDRALARVLGSQPGDLVWLDAHREYSLIPTMELFYARRRLVLPAGQDYFFGDHQSMWRGDYPGVGPDRVARAVYANVCRYVDVLAVFCDPAQAGPAHDNPYSRAVAAHLARRAAEDPRWRRLARVPLAGGGCLAVYRNRTGAAPGSYQKRLRGESLVRGPFPAPGPRGGGGS